MNKDNKGNPYTNKTWKKGNLVEKGFFLGAGGFGVGQFGYGVGQVLGGIAGVLVVIAVLTGKIKQNNE